MKMLPEALRGSIESESAGAEAYEAVRSELEALKEAELLPVNLSVATVVSRVLGALPRLAGFRSALERLPDFDLARLDRLESYAWALWLTHGRYGLATKPPDVVRAVHEDARRLRTLLLKDVELAIARGIVPAASIRHLRGYDGYLNTASDLGLLAHLLKDHFAKLEGKCGTTRSELDHAEKLATRLLRVYGIRELSEDAKAGPRAERARAFTLLVRTYDDARKALLYLVRDPKEVNRIAPSLYAGRGGARR